MRFTKDTAKDFALRELGLFLREDQASAPNVSCWNDIVAELARRVEGDAVKAEVVMDYHYNAFCADPCPKHWNELFAMMALHEKMGGEEKTAPDG